MEQHRKPTERELAERLARFMLKTRNGAQQLEGYSELNVKGDDPASLWLMANIAEVREVVRDYCRSALSWDAYKRHVHHLKWGRLGGETVWGLALDLNLSRSSVYYRAQKEPAGLARCLLETIE